MNTFELLEARAQQIMDDDERWLIESIICEIQIVKNNIDDKLLKVTVDIQDNQLNISVGDCKSTWKNSWSKHSLPLLKQFFSQFWFVVNEQHINDTTFTFYI